MRHENCVKKRLVGGFETNRSEFRLQMRQQPNYSWDDTNLLSNIAGLAGFFLPASFPLGILVVVHVAFNSAGKG